MEANKYQQGKIYAIRSYQTDQIYIGSTCNKLSKRLHYHRNDFKRYTNGKQHYVTSYEILKHPDHYIELIENFPCNDKNELNRREGVRIRGCATAVNKCIAGRTINEWCADNKEHIADYQKQYRGDNKEAIARHKSQYYEDNREKITRQKKQTNTCECGGKYTTVNKIQHEHTKKHCLYMIAKFENAAEV